MIFFTKTHFFTILFHFNRQNNEKVGNERNAYFILLCTISITFSWNLPATLCLKTFTFITQIKLNYTLENCYCMTYFPYVFIHDFAKPFLTLLFISTVFTYFVIAKFLFTMFELYVNYLFSFQVMYMVMYSSCWRVDTAATTEGPLI